MIRLVSLLGIAAVALAAAAVKTGSRQSPKPRTHGGPSTKLLPRLRTPILAEALPFHARFSVN